MTQSSRALVLSLLVATSSAGAQTAERFSVGVDVGYMDFTSAPKSAAAVFDGARGGLTYGGDVRFALTHSWFVDAGARGFSKDGERVFVADASSQVFPLGHPLRVRLTPIYGLVGWRFRPNERLVPYAALGGGVTSYHEESTVAGVTTSESTSKASLHLVGGADYALGHLGLGVEVRWTSIPDVVGLGGVSKVYGETDLGGIVVVARISYRR
jgi:opacity protein-like surface antigen